MSKPRFHLLPNAHLDPVWLWDWREGFNEAETTVNCVLDMMDANKRMTFIRGEAALYSHIEKTHPKTFKRIMRRVEEGRWDVVGGTWIQPDTNLPSTEAFCRHFAVGKRYFKERFGVDVRAAWAADSFGHSAGLPEIFEAAGIDCFAFSRPQPNLLPLEKPAFWWLGQGGAKILSWRIPVGWYGCERAKIKETLDQYLAESPKWGLDNVAVFFGLGDHGGGPSKRMFAEIQEWAKAHPEVEIVNSTLHGYFDALKKELSKKGSGFIPEHKGELNFTLRGCYSSAAKLKFKYRKLESSLSATETVNAAVSCLLDKPAACLRDSWEAALFNSFHDILPGSSIERAYDEQLAQIGGALHNCSKALFSSVNELAKGVDCSVEKPKGDHPSGVPLLVFNPHPFAYDGPVELEASLDYRPIWEYQDRGSKLPYELLDAARKPVSFQDIHTEHNFHCEKLPWRKRALAKAKIPPLGWSLFELRWREGATNPKPSGQQALSPKPGVIDNGLYRVEAKAGAKGVNILKNGKPLFGKDGLSIATYEDPFGSWGDEETNMDCIDSVRELWHVKKAKVLESGPLRASLWIRLEAGHSWLELTVSLVAGRDAVDFSARMLFDEKAARVKLLFPACDGKVECQVPGGSVVRENVKGEVPGGRWAKVSAKEPYGFASDALYNFDASKGLFRATVVRSGHYSCGVPLGPDEAPELPATDSGEYRFKFLVGPAGKTLERLADELEMPPVAQTVPPLKGTKFERSGSLLEIEGGSFKLLALKPAFDGKGMILRIQETAGKACELKLKFLGKALKLGQVKPFKIAAFRIKKAKGGFSTSRISC